MSESLVVSSRPRFSFLSTRETRNECNTRIETIYDLYVGFADPSTVCCFRQRSKTARLKFKITHPTWSTTCFFVFNPEYPYRSSDWSFGTGSIYRHTPSIRTDGVVDRPDNGAGTVRSFFRQPQKSIVLPWIITCRQKHVDSSRDNFTVKNRFSYHLRSVPEKSTYSDVYFQVQNQWRTSIVCTICFVKKKTIVDRR